MGPQNMQVLLQPGRHTLNIVPEEVTGRATNASRSCCCSSSIVHGFDRQTDTQCFSADWDCRPEMSARPLKIPRDDCIPQGQELMNGERFTLKCDTTA